MFAAAFDLVPEHEKAFIGEFLSKKGMTCSVYGAQFLLEALFKLRCGDAAVELMLSNGPRSWLAMLEKGATVTYEAWSAADKPNMSAAHPWGSAAGNQIARGIFGLQPLKPGWEEYSFDPQPGKIKSARIILPTVRGFIHAEFTCSGGEIRKSAELKNTPDPDFVR